MRPIVYIVSIVVQRWVDRDTYYSGRNTATPCISRWEDRVYSHVYGHNIRISVLASRRKIRAIDLHCHSVNAPKLSPRIACGALQHDYGRDYGGPPRIFQQLNEHPGVHLHFEQPSGFFLSQAAGLTPRATAA
jgi:hypothetical protein